MMSKAQCTTGVQLAALAQLQGVPVVALRSSKELRIDRRALSPEHFAGVCDLVATSEVLESLTLTDTRLTVANVTALADAIHKSKNGLLKLNISGENELGDAESALRAAACRSALLRPGREATLLLPIESDTGEHALFLSCIAPARGASLDELHVCARTLVRVLVDVELNLAKRLFAQLVSQVFPLIEPRAAAMLCLQIGVVCRKRAKNARFEDADHAAAMALMSDAAISALGAVISQLPIGGATAEPYWAEFDGIFEEVIERSVVQLTRLPTVQNAHYHTFFGSVGTVARTAARAQMAARRSVSLVALSRRTPLEQMRHAVWSEVMPMLVAVAYALGSLVVQPLFLALFTVLPDSHRFVHRHARVYGHSLVWVTDPWLRLLYDRLSSLFIVYCVLWMPAVFTTADTGHFSVWALVFTAGMVGGELEELISLGFLRSPISGLRRFLADEWNVVDALGLGCALGGLPWYIAHNAQVPSSSFEGQETGLNATLTQLSSFDEAMVGGIVGVITEQTAGVQRHIASLVPTVRNESVLACAVFALTIRQLRVLYLSRLVGPYVQVMNYVISDVAKMAALAMPLVLSFAFAFVMLYKQPQAMLVDSDCSTLQSDSFHRIDGAVALLVEILIGGQDAEMSCVRPAQGAWIMLLIFLLVSLVLLLNMLIAAMTRTFDIVAERSDAFATFNLCKLAQSASRLPLVPPPLNLIGLPSRVLLELARVFVRGAVCSLHEFGVRTPRFALLEEAAETDAKDAAAGENGPRSGRQWSHASGWSAGAIAHGGDSGAAFEKVMRYIDAEMLSGGGTRLD